jgi:hypothetical protein
MAPKENQMLTITEVKTRPMSRTQKAGRVYVWLKGENVLENFVARHNRPHQVYRDYLVDALERVGASLEGCTVNWSQKAGCGCGCSPGFVVRGLRTDVHITLLVEGESK